MKDDISATATNVEEIFELKAKTLKSLNQKSEWSRVDFAEGVAARRLGLGAQVVGLSPTCAINQLQTKCKIAEQRDLVDYYDLKDERGEPRREKCCSDRIRFEVENRVLKVFGILFVPLQKMIHFF